MTIGTGRATARLRHPLPGSTLGAVTGQSLTPRESAVLAAIERRLNNPEIAAELFISVRTVESHIASLKRKLGAENRAQLMASAEDRRGHAASVRLPRNAFVGRDDDLATLAEQVDRHRLITVVGPGGVGKTRLALEFASHVHGERLPVIVELEHAEPGDVVARIAKALGLEAASGIDVAACIAVALATHSYLLVLDNIDRVGPAVAWAVGRIHATAPDLRVLTTSRTPIGDDAEHVHPLAPLAADGAGAASVAMFLDRLGAHGRHGDLASPGPRGHLASRAEIDLAAEICARLDGLPLAIELAAACARHLSLAELASRLERDFATLDRAVPLGRHRTLETAFEWTWDLLTDEERDVLCRLAALPRTFDVDLAAAVTHPGAEGDVLRLLDHSMLVPAGGYPRRFRLLAVMREFVHARTDPAIVREVLERHAEYHVEIVEDFVSRARVDNSPEAQNRSVGLCPETNAALRWTLAAGHPLALTFAADLSIGIEQYGSDVDSLGSIAMAARDERVLAEASAGQLLVMGTALAYYDLQIVDELAGRALEVARAHPDDARTRLAAEHLAGLADGYSGRQESALLHLDEAERIAAELDESWELAAVHHTRGLALRGASREDAARAIAELEQAMRGYALAGDMLHASSARFNMALISAEAGLEPEQAARWAAECADYAASIGNEHELAHAHLVQQMLQVPDAAESLDELLEAFRRLGDLRCVTRCMLLQADRAEPRGRRLLLERALEFADAGGDRANQTAIRERLTAMV